MQLTAKERLDNAVRVFEGCSRLVGKYLGEVHDEVVASEIEWDYDGRGVRVRFTTVESEAAA